MGLFNRKKKEEEVKKVNTNEVHIKIFRDLGKGLYAQAAEFKAAEKPDANTNLIASNEDARFKEDLNFVKDRVYEILEYELELQDKDLKEKAKILDQKIKEKQDFIKKFETNDEEKKIELNTNYNFQDEELRLRQLRVLRDSLKYQKLGNYVRLGQNGIRTYEFLSLDGVLYPFVFGGKYPRAHPDMTINKKIFNQENTIFTQQMGLNLNKALTWMTVVFIAICMVWSGALGFWTYKNMKWSDEMDLRVNQNGMVCNNAMATLVQKYGGIVNDYYDLKKDEIEILKKNENPNTNKQTEIDISP